MLHRRRDHTLQLNQLRIRALEMESKIARDSLGDSFEAQSLSADYEPLEPHLDSDVSKPLKSFLSPKPSESDLKRSRVRPKSVDQDYKMTRPMLFQGNKDDGRGIDQSPSQCEDKQKADLTTLDAGIGKHTHQSNGFAGGSSVRIATNNGRNSDSKQAAASHISSPKPETVVKLKQHSIDETAKKVVHKTIFSKLKNLFGSQSSSSPGNGEIIDGHSVNKSVLYVGYIIYVIHADEQFDNEHYTTQTYELSLAQEELRRLVLHFHKKKKIVMERCAKLSPEILDIINKEIRSREKSNNASRDETMWSLVMLRILPKRARKADVKAVQFILQSAELGNQPPGTDTREPDTATTSHAFVTNPKSIKGTDEPHHDLFDPRSLRPPLPFFSDTGHQIDQEGKQSKPSDNDPQPHLKFKDAVGRKFVFPWHQSKTWKGMDELIQQAF